MHQLLSLPPLPPFADAATGASRRHQQPYLCASSAPAKPPGAGGREARRRPACRGPPQRRCRGTGRHQLQPDEQEHQRCTHGFRRSVCLGNDDPVSLKRAATAAVSGSVALHACASTCLVPTPTSMLPSCCLFRLQVPSWCAPPWPHKAQCGRAGVTTAPSPATPLRASLPALQPRASPPEPAAGRLCRHLCCLGHHLWCKCLVRACVGSADWN